MTDETSAGFGCPLDATPTPSLALGPEGEKTPAIVSASLFSDSEKWILAAGARPSRGTLQSYVGSPELTGARKIIVLYGVARALVHLHANGIVHGDLRPSNISLNHNFEPSVSGYRFNWTPSPTDGNERLRLGSGVTNPRALPAVYRAPEMNTGSPFSEQTDVYAFGILMYHILCKDELVTSLDMKKRVQPSSVAGFMEVIGQGMRFRYARSIPGFYWELILACWDEDPAVRPSAQKIVEELEKDEAMVKRGDREILAAYKRWLQGNEGQLVARDCDVAE
jgi:serine/threonine protein kinase